ncbi:MAG TPA: nuclear transport factor 2 family protein [Candidatus Acidoferrales bacterium]|nr:nuclear transport factor 2 family protein [Candidatus Acidoferrales bacterium]
MKRLQAMCAAILAITFIAAAAQQQKPTKKQKNAPLPHVAQSISDQIDHDIGEMLGAWQVGDVEAMQKYYADDATWVAGTYDPPIAGWLNYVPKYEQSRRGVSSVQLIRKNTTIFHYGDTAWAAYQWEFQGFVEGKPMTARGQTTLVFVKNGDRWLIVHNHTSQICPGA